MRLSFQQARRTLIQSLVPWISWGEDPEALHFVCFPNITPEPEGASGLHLLFTACPTALQKYSFAPCTVLRVSRDVLTRFLITINQGGSHTQSWVWFVLLVEKEAPAQMSILKSMPMNLWANWPSLQEWCCQAESRPWGETCSQREQLRSLCSSADHHLPSWVVSSRFLE